MSAHDTEVEDTTVYKVVINHEEQYSIWPESRENPAGWTSVGVAGSKAVCLGHIESVWTDMRPLSLRKAMESAGAAHDTMEAAAEASEAPVPRANAEPPVDPLPVRLSRGPQPVELCVRPERTLDALARQIETGYVHVRFTATRGGTELTFPLDAGTVDQVKSQVARGSGLVQVSGNMTLDYIPVRCVADIDLGTFTGTGMLHIVGERASGSGL